MKHLPAISICAAFLAICARYALQIELWGDEVASLEYAGQSWRFLYWTLPSFDPVHFPTYYFALKLQIAAIGESLFTLRVFHAIGFAIGLWFGYRTVLLLTASTRVALLALVSAVCIPEFAFYATALRMYAILFPASMWFVYRLAVVLFRGPRTDPRDRLLLGIASTCLVLIDLPGLLLVAAGVVILLVSSKPGDRLRSALVPAVPAVAFLVYLPSYLDAPFGEFVASKVRSVNAVSPDVGFDPMHFAKLVYLALRPALNLTSQAQPAVLLAYGLPCLVAGALGLTGVLLLRRRGQWPKGGAVLLVVSFYWMAVIPIGYSIPRAFLPAAFFLPVILLLDWGKLPRPVVVANRVLFLALLLTNLALVVQPTLRVASRTPADRIVTDIKNRAEVRGVADVVLLENTLNVWTIERRLRRDPAAGEIETHLIPVDFDAGDLPTGRFVYVSHIADVGGSYGAERLTRDFDRRVSAFGNYVSLAELPYNGPWIRQILTRAGEQAHLVNIYEVESSSD